MGAFVSPFMHIDTHYSASAIKWKSAQTENTFLFAWGDVCAYAILSVGFDHISLFKATVSEPENPSSTSGSGIILPL